MTTLFFVTNSFMKLPFALLYVQDRASSFKAFLIPSSFHGVSHYCLESVSRKAGCKGSHGGTVF